jgi:hypothetical protein
VGGLFQAQIRPARLPASRIHRLDTPDNETPIGRPFPITLLTGFGDEERYLRAFATDFDPLVPKAVEFDVRNRVLPIRTRAGIKADIALGALPFEEQAVSRAGDYVCAEGGDGPPEPYCQRSAGAVGDLPGPSEGFRRITGRAPAACREACQPPRPLPLRQSDRHSDHLGPPNPIGSSIVKRHGQRADRKPHGLRELSLVEIEGQDCPCLEDARVRDVQDIERAMAAGEGVQFGKSIRFTYERRQVAGGRMKQPPPQIRIESSQRFLRVALRNDFSECCESNRVRELVAIQRRDGNRLLRLARPILSCGGVRIAAEQGE